MTSQLPGFWCLFLSCQQQKNTKNRAAVTSLGPSYSVTTLLVEPFNSIFNQPGWQKSDACVN